MAVAVALAVAYLLASSVEAGAQALGTLSSDPGPPPSGAGADGEHASDRLIVTYEPGTPDPAEDKVAREVGGRVEEEIEPLNAAVVTLPEVERERPGEARAEALDRAKEELEVSPDVAEVEYDRLRSVSYIPNDPGFGRQWGLKRAVFPTAWDREDGDGSPRTPGTARIAVVDTGIQGAHPDLKGKVLAQRDFVDDDAIAQDDSSEGHGTHVAGIAAAATRNSRGIAGGCPNCTILAAKVIDGSGNGYSSDIAEGIVWAANRGAKVINLSLGGPGSVGVENDAVDYAVRKGAVVVGAAGNGAQFGNEPEYPAAYGPVVAVAATNRYDKRAPFSIYGSYVDVAAPGVGIYSTIPSRSYASYSGTSMASPHVAALAGLLAAQGRTRTQITSRIVSTAKDLGPAGRDPYYGAGRINAAAAVR